MESAACCVFLVVIKDSVHLRNVKKGEDQILRKFFFVFKGVSRFGPTSRFHWCSRVSQLTCKVILFFPQDLILPNGGTPAGTASPASSSSLLNRLQLDDDMDGETRDLFVTVDDPKKHVCTMETYITYRITTKVGPCVLVRLCALLGEAVLPP